ncbi:MAG TPA: PAS domain S-box protein [Steroidobacteraceae bacterium]|nr:PAS domain S-box protein [Steroidobacteraceae bacterium]
MPTIAPELARSALDAAPDAMVIIDAGGIVRYANQQVTAVFGYSHEDVIGQKVEQLMPERYRARHLGHRDRYVQNVRIRPMGQGLELFGRRRDGSEFPVEISLSPIVHDGRALTAAAIRDVTDRKKVEAELILARESAERAREIADRAREIADEARELADRANQGKSRFLATASHDLRQPLQTLALLNGALRRIDTDPDSAEALVQQEQAIGAMSRLLNALLDISKLESGAIKPEPTDFTVAGLFEELRQEFAGLAANKGLRLEVEPCAESVHSDPSLVEQILRNIISNAVKYTRQGWVRLRCLHEDSIVRLEVADTGIGIPADQISLIYDEFYQVGVPANSSREGYGLGLSIVQRLVKLLQLQLDVRSEVGKGSSFCLRVPAAERRFAMRAAKPPAAPMSARPVQKTRLLLVEDDAAVRNATRLLLKVEGYEVITAESLAEAVRKAREVDGVELLVTDYHLSHGETGIHVLRALRDVTQTALKAVLVTGDTSTAIRELPQDPLLRVASKPIKAEELLGLIKSLLTA